jgi:hypothetical protein
MTEPAPIRAPLRALPGPGRRTEEDRRLARAMSRDDRLEHAMRVLDAAVARDLTQSEIEYRLLRFGRCTSWEARFAAALTERVRREHGVFVVRNGVTECPPKGRPR